MTEQNSIIDVVPIRHSSSRIGADQVHASGKSEATARDEKRSPSSVLAGLVQTAVGAGLVAIGIPMLVLPGPGLLSIGAGVFLAARGLSKVSGR
ncbi:MAG: hypothetical protein IJ087_02450 [Eggerthellaceae bacterium]|nr:hypothetical protein [Eggerthellaceae bacterium]